MKTFPFRFVPSSLIIMVLTLSSISLRAQNFPEPIPTVGGGQIIHAILREGDVNLALAGKSKENRHPSKKSRSDKGKGKPRAKSQPKDAPKTAPKGNADCPACKKAKGGVCEKCKKQAAPIARGEGRPKPPPVGDHKNSSDRREDMRKRFEEMRKKGGPWAENHRRELGDMKELLERTTKELDQARQSLHMAHKELGDKTLHVKKLTEALGTERKKNENLQNNIKVVQKKAHEAIAQIQAQAKKHVEESHARVMVEKPRAPKKAQPASRKKPAPKPAARTVQSVAPISFTPNSAVNYAERVRVLKEIKAIVAKSPAAKIKLIGHADDSPYDQVNQEISTNRASFLGSFLRVNGIDSAKISHKGSGNTAPKKGARHNRRVVIEIVK